MGYVLPIKSIQAEQYTNRMNLEPYDLATIGRIQRVNLKSDFLEAFEESLQSQSQQEKEEEKLQAVPSSHSYTAYIQPNPVNLSPVISQIVGKGMNINAYV